MLTKVRSVIEKYKLVAGGDSVLVACSGGPDSLALVHIFYQLRADYNINLAVAHVNHMLRGSESDADAAFVAEFCARLDLPYFQTSVDVPGYVAGYGFSTEEAARILRYRYLRQIAKQLGGAKIAVGHHQDDQAETILLNLFRGAGSAGLTGMKPARDEIIRPLLMVSRQEIDDYCHSHDLLPRLDSTNLKSDYSRNYLRIELMPLIKRRFNANISETLARTALLVSDEHEFIATQADKLWPEVVQESSGEDVNIDCLQLNSLHSALRREIFRKAIAKKRGDLKGITFFHVERLIELALNGSVGSVIELPGKLVARKGYRQVVLTAALPAVPSPGIPAPGSELKVPGVTILPALGLIVTARLFDVRPMEEEGVTATFPCAGLVPPLYVRTRQDGDRFWPAGSVGGKKLKSFFIDNKIPRENRDQIPIFCDQRGIFWVGGYRRAERTESGGDSNCFLELTITTGGLTSD